MPRSPHTTRRPAAARTLMRDLRKQATLRIVPTLLAAHEIPPELRGNRREWIRRIVEEILPRASRDGLAEFCDVFCEEGYFTVEESREVLCAAARLGLGLRIMSL